MNSNTLLGGIEVNVGNEINNIDLVMAFDTQVLKITTKINMSYVLTVTTYQKR
jgi:hypothetical protein